MANFDGSPTGRLGDSEVDNDVVVEARERLQRCMDAEDRDEALDDLRFSLGGVNQWQPEAVYQRNLDGRPTITNNNIPAIIHQVTNDARRNKQSVHIAPVDDEADPEIAEIIGGIIRHIEYDSGADAAYDTALESAARIGFGYFRLVTEYESATSFDQVIKIKRIRNPFTVYIDPDAQEADGSDMQFAIISSKVPRTEFQRQFPKASGSADGIGAGTGDNIVWAGADYVRIAEYYRIEHTPATVVMFGDGSTMLASDPQYAEAVATKGQAQVARTTSVPKVMWYKLTGSEVLEKAEIPCPWIPVFPVYGDEVDVDGQMTRFGLIRNAKDPKRMENYWISSATEEIALRTKTPFIGAIGQFEGVEADWQSANVRNFSYLEYNPVTIEGSLAPPPQRQPPADVPTGFIQMAALARDSVKAVTSIYDASLGNRSNETSGIAIRSRQQQGDIANFHLSDNLTRAITRMAKCIIPMIQRIYDTQRIVRILGEDRRTATPVEVNKPEMKQDPERGAIETVLNDLTVGTYDVTVSTGPAYNTLREETVANMIEVGGKWPKLFEIAGDKLVKAMDWPEAQEIAERIAASMPPGLVKKDDEETENMVQTPNGPIPAEQAGQLLAQLDDTVQKMSAELEDAQSGLAKARIDAESRERVAEINAQSRQDVEELKGMIAMMLDRMSPMLAHEAAIVAAADPEHPAQPAPIAQGVPQSPVAEMAAQPEPGASAEGTE